MEIDGHSMKFDGNSMKFSLVITLRKLFVCPKKRQLAYERRHSRCYLLSAAQRRLRSLSGLKRQRKLKQMRPRDLA